MKLFADWRASPANFTVKTRATAARGATTSAGRANATVLRPAAAQGAATGESGNGEPDPGEFPTAAGTGYRSAFPIRPGLVVGISNIPSDLTKAEAERLAQFITMLAVE